MTGDRLGQAGAWLAVGALVLSAHVAAAAWAMRQPGQALPAAPDAIEIDLAPPPGASEAGTAAPQATPNAPEFTPKPVEPLPRPGFSSLVPPEPEFTPPEVEPLTPPDFSALVPPEPVPDFAPPPVVPMPPPDFASLAPPVEPPVEAAPTIVPPPPRRPERLVRREPEKPRRDEPRREERRKEPRNEPRPETRRTVAAPPRAARGEQRQEQRQPSRQGQGGTQSARQPADSGSGASRQAQASWKQRAGATVSKHMSRTRLPGRQGGTIGVTVIVSVSPNGATRARLAGSTGDPRIDAALARQAARMPKLPPPPSGKPFEFQQPVEIQR